MPATAIETPGVLHHFLHWVGLGRIADRAELRARVWHAVGDVAADEAGEYALRNTISKARLNDIVSRQARLRALDAVADNRSGRGSVDESGPI